MSSRRAPLAALAAAVLVLVSAAVPSGTRADAQQESLRRYVVGISGMA